MKKLLILGLSMMFVLLSSAKPISMAKARQIAAGQLRKPLVETQLPLSLRKRMVALSADTPAFYVFNAKEKNAGFVVVSGDDEMPELVGYSDVGCFPEDVEMPPALADFLAFYSQYVSDVRAGVAEPPLPRSKRQAPRIVKSPLLSSRFGQDAPYNNLCLDSHKLLCPCGCVATAAAQIMHYWQWPQQSGAQNGYDWSVVYPTTEENLASEEASQTIAQICRDIGSAVDMNYTPTGSGAHSNKLVNALVQRFNFLPTTIRQHYRICSASAEEWFDMIARELSANRPVYYSAVSTTGSGRDAGGHAFVVDGCNESGFVHVNWGWDGQFNGDYDIAMLNPQAYNFVEDQSIITGIQPNRSGVTGMPTDYMQLRGVPEYTGAATFRNSLEFKISFSGLYNMTANTHNWEYTVGIFDTSLKLLGTIHTDRSLPSAALNTFYYLPEVTINCKLNAYSDGEYVLRVIFREKGATDWMLPDVVGGQMENMIPVRIANKKVTMYAEDVEIITGIDRVNVDDNAQLSSLNSYPSSRIAVYSLNGQVLYTGDAEGLSLSGLKEHGVLIVKQGNSVRKILR